MFIKILDLPSTSGPKQSMLHKILCIMKLISLVVKLGFILKLMRRKLFCTQQTYCKSGASFLRMAKSVFHCLVMHVYDRDITQPLGCASLSGYACL